MRILVVLAETYLPQQGGGAQSSARELVLAFRDRGMEAAIAASLRRRSAFGLRATGRMALARTPFLRERRGQELVYRAPHLPVRIGAILDDYQPDVVLLQAMAAMPVAHAISRLGRPLVVYWRDAELHRMEGTPVGLRARYLANSSFTAGFYEAHFGVRSVVVPPLIRAPHHTAPTRDPRTVTFIGSAPEKGLDIAFGVAEACPDIPFEFVESWILSRRARRVLEARAARLPNVTFTPHQSSMLGIYGRTRILLAPSQWQEAWGRVASEAHLNAIPVVGSRIGGLAEAIGPGGVLLDATAPVAEWAAAVRDLWGDPLRWAALSQAALAYSRRPDLDPETALSRILEVLAAAVGDGASPPGHR